MTLSHYDKIYKIGGIGVTYNHTAKMSGLHSLSTSSCTCPGCQMKIDAGKKLIESQIPNFDFNAKNVKKQLAKAADAGTRVSICLLCFSESMQGQYEKLKNKLQHNTEILTTRILSDSEMPVISSLYFRFEAYGDLKTTIQVVNYFNIARKNPGVKCALWTKNPWIIDAAINEYGLKKPRNLKIIGSSYFINSDMSNYYQKFDFIDNCFTVYSKRFIKKNDIKITCGARSCLTCARCYNGKHKSFNICEELK